MRLKIERARVRGEGREGEKEITYIVSAYVLTFGLLISERRSKKEGEGGDIGREEREEPCATV